MLKICLVSCKSEPQYAYKRYAYNKKYCTTAIVEKGPSHPFKITDF